MVPRLVERVSVFFSKSNGKITGERLRRLPVKFHPSTQLTKQRHYGAPFGHRSLDVGLKLLLFGGGTVGTGTTIALAEEAGSWLRGPAKDREAVNTFRLPE
jgi:hypothetical protein